MAFSRSERRHHYARMVERRYQQNRERSTVRSNEDPWSRDNARVRATTGAPCSCGMCTSPRRVRGNGAPGLTRQELIALQDLRHYAQDV